MNDAFVLVTLVFALFMFVEAVLIHDMLAAIERNTRKKEDAELEERVAELELWAVKYEDLR